MSNDATICQFPPCGKPLEIRKRTHGSPRKFCSQNCRKGMQYYDRIKEYVLNENGYIKQEGDPGIAEKAIQGPDYFD